MVRVFAAYHCRGQHVNTTTENIVASCVMDDDHIILAKSNNIIEIRCISDIGLATITTDTSIKSTSSFPTSSVFDIDETITQRHFSSLNNIEKPMSLVATEVTQKPMSLSFPTVDFVFAILYCKEGNYIVTLEKTKKSVGQTTSGASTVTATPSADDMVYCRVYTNWWCVDPISGCNNILIRARIADKVTPNVLNTNSLEVIELKSLIGIKNIACCQVTGNILIAVDKSVMFYKFKSCTSKSTKLPYIDFQEVPIVVDLEFIIERIVICENFFICGNSDFTVVLKILCETNLVSGNEDFTVPNSTSSTSSSASLASSLQLHSDIGKKDIEKITSTRIDHPHNFENYQSTIINEIAMISTEDDIIKTQTSLSSSNIRSIPDMLSLEYKPIYADIKCKLRHTPTSQITVKTGKYKEKFKLQTLLKIRKRDHRDPFVCLCMKPIYMINSQYDQASLESKRSSNIPFQSTEFQSIYNENLNCVSVLVTTANDGYAYQFKNNQKSSNSDTSYIATYPFTASVIDVAMTDFVLHVLTDHGIETYSLRTNQSVFNRSNEFEFLKLPSSYVQACPKVSDPVCLIGLRQFIGVQKFHCTDSYLILLASTASTISTSSDLIINEHLAIENSSDYYWTIYNIKLPTPQEVSCDLYELACQHKTDSLSTYKLLITEAHIICRTAYQCFIITRNGDSVILERYSNNNCYKELFLQSCLTLADLYVTSMKSEEYYQASQYYIMAGVLINEVYDRAMLKISSMENKPGKFNGLIYTIKNLFIKLHFDADDLISRMLIIPKQSKSNQNFLDGKIKCFGDELLELFLSEPDKLNELFTLNLQSLAFREAMSGKIYQIILSRTEEKSNEEWLCLILELARNKKISAVHNILAELSLCDNYTADCETKNRLFIILIKYWNVLFEKTNIKHQNRTVITFSDLTESFILTAAKSINKNHQLQTTISNIFIYLTIELKVIKIEILVKLILNFLAGQVCDQSCYHSNQFILQCLLEFYFYQNHYRYNNNNNNIEQIKCSNTVIGMQEIDRKTSIISLAEIEPEEFPPKYETKGVASSSASSSSQSSSPSLFKQEQLDGISVTSTNNTTSFRSTTEIGDDDLMKILIRIYLGKLTKFESPTLKTKNYQMICKFLRENIDYIFQYHKTDVYDIENDYNRCIEQLQNNDCKTILNISPIQRPILFLNARPAYLNSMSPFDKNFNIDHVNTNNCSLSELDGDVIKFQSILSSGQLSKDIFQEIIMFFDSNLSSTSSSPSSKWFTGIEGFLCILLPIKKCIQFLIENSPNNLLGYVVTRFYNEDEWSGYLNELFSYNSYITQKYSQQQFQLMLKETLKYLATTKKLPQIIQIFSMDGNYEKSNKAMFSDMFNYYPNVVKCSTEIEKNKKNDVTLMAMSIEHQKESLIGKASLTEEDVLLINHLTEVIDLDRTERLGEMIKTTGYQLYETYNRNKQFFN